MEVDRQEWMQLARPCLDPSSYILAHQDLRGSPIVLFKQGFLAQQEELGLQSEPIKWQQMGPAAAADAAADVAEMEFCLIERVSYQANSPELGRGKRKRSVSAGPFLRVLLERHTAQAGGAKLGLWLEHHVHLGIPEFIIGRQRFEASLARPLLPQQRVRMLWRDATDPAKGDWYTGMVVEEAEEWAPPAGVIWEGVSVIWDTDSSITHVSPWELMPLLLPQPQQTMQQQQHIKQLQQQQQQLTMQQLSGAGLQTAVLPGGSSAMPLLHVQPHAPQYPLLQAGQAPTLGLQAMPRVAEHPKHLPKLHLRRGAAQGLGPKVPSGTSLADPSSGVSADTPDALPWGQQPSLVQDQAVLGPGWALAREHTLRQQQSLGRQQSLGQQQSLENKQSLGQQQPLGQQQSLGEQRFLGERQSLGDQQLLSLQHFMEQQRQSSLGQQQSLGGQQSLGEQQFLSLQQLMEQQQQSLGLEQSAGWRQFLAQHQSVGLQQLPNWPDRDQSRQQRTAGKQPGVEVNKAEGSGASCLNGVRAVPGVDGGTVYAAFLVDDNKAERTLEVFPTAEQAACAHDVAALRQYGLTAESRLNHPLDSYTEVLSELHSYRRTNSTEDMDSPMSIPDSPGFLMSLRSSSLVALGISPASPQAQRQFIASGKRQPPASMRGAKELPGQTSHGLEGAGAAEDDDLGGGGDCSGSRGGGKQRPARAHDGRSTYASKSGGKHRPSPSPPKRRAAAEDGDHGGADSKKGGKHLPTGLCDGRSTCASRNGGKHRPSRSSGNRLAVSVGRSKPGHRQTDTSEAQSPSDLDSDSSCQNASSSSAQVSSDEEQAQEGDSGQRGSEDWVPSPSGKGNLRVNLRLQRNRQKASDTQDGEEQENDASAPSDEEDWTGSPVTRSRRSLKVKSGLRKSSVSTNPRVLAARRATVAGRKRSDKLSNFSGVTLKNGRIAVMLWNPHTKKPIHLGYWPSSLAAARMADKARLSADFRRNDADLNFPKGDYSQQELSSSIAHLADFIREDQSMARAAELSQKPTSDSSSSRQRRGAATSSRSADTAGRVRFSHFLGVSWNTQRGVWQARIHKADGSPHCIGDFPQEEAAGRAYDEYALQHLGKGAVRNFPPSTYTGHASDDEEAYPCLKQYAADGDDWLFSHVPTSRHAKAQKSKPQAGAAAAASSAAATAPAGPSSRQMRSLTSAAPSPGSD